MEIIQKKETHKIKIKNNKPKKVYYISYSNYILSLSDEDYKSEYGLADAIIK